MAKGDLKFNQKKGFNKFLNENNILLRLDKNKNIVRLDIEKSAYEIISGGFIKVIAIVKLHSEIGAERYEAYVHLLVRTDEGDLFEDEDKLFSIRFRIYLPSEMKLLANGLNDTDNRIFRNQMDLSIVNPSKHISMIEVLAAFPIHNKSIFIKAMELYLLYKWEQAEELNNIYTYAAGWKEIKHDRTSSIVNEFIGVTYDSWNLDFMKDMRFHGIENNDNNYSSLEVINENLFHSPVLTMLFVYNIIAISNDRIFKLVNALYKPYAENLVVRKFPAISIYGKRDDITRKAVANILLNWFEVNPKRLNSIKMTNNVHLDSALHFHLSRKQGKDMPFLVTTRPDLSNRDFLRVRSIIADELIDFPVFIAQNKSPYKEIVDFEMGSMDGFPTDRETQIKIREAIDNVLVGFIWAERVLGEGITFNKNIHKLVEEEVKELFQDIYHEEDSHFAIIFLIAFEIFGYYMRDQGLGDKFKPIKDSIFQYWKARARILEQEEGQDLIAFFVDYIEHVFSNHVDDLLHWEGVERNGGREASYYIEHSKFYRSFCKFIGSEIPEAQLNEVLRESGILKVRSNKTSIAQYRIHDGQKVYALIVSKEKIKEIKKKENV